MVRDVDVVETAQDWATMLEIDTLIANIRVEHSWFKLSTEIWR